MFEENLVEINDEVIGSYTIGKGEFHIIEYADGRKKRIDDKGRQITYRNVKPFDDKEIQFKIIHFHSDEEEEDTFVVTDKFGKNLSKHFKEIQYIVPFNHSECVVIGIDINGKKITQRLSCGTYYPEDSFSFNIDLQSPIHHVSYVDEETLLFGTDQGYCLVDSNAGWGNFPQKTEFRPKEDFNEILQNGQGNEKPKKH